MIVPLPTGTADLARARFDRADGASIHLSQREVTMLAYLADRAGRDVPRDELRTEVWGQHAQSLSRAVDTTVTRLRHKIEADPKAPEVLCTAFGEGYRLVLDTPTTVVAPTRAPMLDLGDRVVDLAAGLVRGDGPPTALTAQERRLLAFLAEHPGAVIDPGRLARSAGCGRVALWSTVRRLRAKIESDPERPRHLVALRGQGYRLDTAPARPALSALLETLWAVAEHTGRILGLNDCVVYARDGNHLLQVAAHGPKAPRRGDIASAITLRVDQGIVGTAARTATAQCVADVRGDPRYVADLAPARSELAVPIVHDGRVVGVLDSESPEVAAYRPEHRVTFESLAGIAAAALRDVAAVAA